MSTDYNLTLKDLSLTLGQVGDHTDEYEQLQITLNWWKIAFSEILWEENTLKF